MHADLILEKLGYYISHNVEEDSRFVVAAQPLLIKGARSVTSTFS